MFIKNRLKAGDFVTVIPVGLPLQIHYNQKGYLDRCTIGWADSKSDKYKEVFSYLIDNSTVPRHVSIKEQNLTVKGILYTSKHYLAEGPIPECLIDSYVADIVKGDTLFNFFAIEVASGGSVAFRGASSARKWLAMSGFNILPGFITPAIMNDQVFETLILNDNFNFEYPMLSHLAVFENNTVSYYSNKLMAVIATEVEQATLSDGNIVANIFSEMLDDPIQVDWSVVVKHNIFEGSCIIVNEDNLSEIYYSYDVSSKKRVRPITCECKFCGKTIHVKPNSPQKTMCENAHCNSRLFKPTNRFLEILDQPQMNYDTYCEMISKFGKIYSIPDVLDYEIYENVTVTTTLSTLLKSIVPPAVLIGTNNFDYIIDKCNNSITSLEHYLSYPDDMVVEFNLENKREFHKFIEWIKDNENFSDVMSVLHHERIRIVSSLKKFEGVPIFRGKPVVITGKFAHGSSSEISSILSSYGANVSVNKYVNDTSIVVVGDIKEDVNGKVIRLAKEFGVPIMEEHQFFNKYRIDEDLHKNL